MAEFEFPDIVIPHDDVPTSAVVPDDIYELQVEELVGSHTRASDVKKSKLMVQYVFTVVKGATTQDDYAGVTVRSRNYILGSENDPDARDPKTWREPMKSEPPGYGVIQYAEVNRALGFQGNERLRVIAEKCKHRRVYGVVVIQKDNNEQSPFYGQDRNNITKYMPMSGGGMRGSHAENHQEQSVNSRPQPQRRPAYNAPEGHVDTAMPVAVSDEQDGTITIPE